LESPSLYLSKIATLSKLATRAKAPIDPMISACGYTMKKE
jgi:hypothetical protein